MFWCIALLVFAAAGCATQPRWKPPVGKGAVESNRDRAACTREASVPGGTTTGQDDIFAACMKERGYHIK